MGSTELAANLFRATQTDENIKGKYNANENISIDLDDGVKVKYAKFQDIKVINSKGKEVKMNLLSKI